MEAVAIMDREAPRTVSAATVLACAWPALLLAAVCLLPFLNKPFNVDDPWFLIMAQQIVKHPMRPMDFDICWDDKVAHGCRNDYQFASGNPLMGEVGEGYVLVPTVLAGTHEWMAHLTELVLAWIAILAMASLVLRLGWDRWHAIAGALLLVAIPPFLPMASTAMPEVLATALAVLGVERLAAWKVEHKWGEGAVAAIALGLAGFARPHLVLLLPLAAFFLLDSTRPREILAQIRRELWLWIPVLAGSGLLLGIILAARNHNLAITPHVANSGWGNIPFNLMSYLLYLTVPLPLAACWLANRLRTGRPGAVVKVFALAFIVIASQWLMGKDENLAELGLPLTVIFLAVVGCGVLSGLFLEAWRKRDHTALFLMLWIMIPLPTIIYVHLPIKYLLPCVPAVILLCFRLLDGAGVRVARVVAVALIVAGTGYSILILRSDAEYAEFGRDALHELIAPQVAAGGRVWYFGPYFSNWYAPQDGAKLLLPGGPQPKAGDLVVLDVMMGGDWPLKPFPHRTLVETVTHHYRFGRTMGDGVGLYDNWCGMWLWGLGDSVHNRFELWRID